MRKLPLLLTAFFFLIFIAGCDRGNVDIKREKPLVTTWHKDILPGYEARYVNQGIAFDGPCRSTIVRRKSDSVSKKGYLYIHGFNDYFFQSEMGERFVDSGYNFYAVDLRRYGRSLEKWQYPFNVRHQEEYFADIDSAIVQMVKDGNKEIILSGHSTGGLTALLYTATGGVLSKKVDMVVTDSPFIEWNYNWFMRNVAVYLVSFAGIIYPEGTVKQSHCDGYAYSLLKKYHGEWTYNTNWKMIYSPPVKFGWVRSINDAQNKLMAHAEDIRIPVLVMHSSRKVEGCNWTPAFMKGDAVLDPFMIQKRGEKLGHEREVVIIDNGLHDLILSSLPARDKAYETIFSFIRKYKKQCNDDEQN